MSRMILGLTGTNGAGKTALSEYLRTRGFEYYSLSDEIREELGRRGETATRENLIGMGNRLRREFGPAVLAERVKARLQPGRNVVVDSVRNPAEVESLRRLPDFHLLYLDAPVEVRYARARQRGDARTPAALEQFIAQEQRELAREFEGLFGKEYLQELLRQDRARVAQEAEALFERAARHYADVKVPYGDTVGEKARAELFEIRHLSVGREAPDIEGQDQDGKRFKLSDYRGKVVLLDFWHQQ